MIKLYPFIAVALLSLALGCQPSAPDSFAPALAEARLAVVAFGHQGTVTQKHRALNIIHQRTRAKAKDLFGSPREAFLLGQVRKGYPVPKLASGPLTDEERLVLESVNEPLSESDVQAAAAAVRDDAASPDAKRRLAAIERLFSAGEAGLPSLAELMRDSNPEVAASAAKRLHAILIVVDSSKEIAACVKACMLATDDEATLAKFGSLLVMCEERSPAVSTAAAVIQTGSPAQATAARDAYSTITGDEWIDQSSADAWIKENCPDEND